MPMPTPLRGEFCACKSRSECQRVDVYFPMYADVAPKTRRTVVTIVPTGYSRHGFRDRTAVQDRETHAHIMQGALEMCNLPVTTACLALSCLGVKSDEGPDSARNVRCTGFRRECQDMVWRHESAREHVTMALGHWLWRISEGAWELPAGGAPVQRGLVKYMSRVDREHAPDHGWALVLFCRSGRHRSVAWATILMNVLRARGYLPTMDMGATDLGGTCKGLCPACSHKPSTDFDLARAAIVKVWDGWHRAAAVVTESEKALARRQARFAADT